MKEPDHFGETLPEEGVQLAVCELREMACRQQAQIESQQQLLAAKEQRLRYLKEQEARQQRVHAESERLRRLRDRVDAQELKLRKLRALRGQVDHHKQNNISLTSDLDSIRALFNEKEKELSLAVAKVEELTRQLEELRRGRSSRDQPPPSALELDKLRRELMYRNKLNEQQNQRLNQQREALTARQEEMNAIDKRISELQDRLHRKRLLNQQLANQISATSHKAAYHQLVRLTGNAEQNNQAFRKQQQGNSQPPNGLSRGNIAAVEPYNHVPLQNSHHNIRAGINNVQENSTYHSVYQSNHHIKKENDALEHSSQDSQELANKMANLYIARQDEVDNLKEFAVSKSDPKYQTLPYNTKFTVNLLPNRAQQRLENQQDNNNMNNGTNGDSGNKEEATTVPSHPSLSNGVNVQSAHMTVHSAPLSIVNKNIATPLNQNDLLSRKSSVELGKEQSQQQNLGGLTNGTGYQQQVGRTTTSEHVAYSANHSVITTAPSNGILYQKPISSVAPTSVHHSGVISNIYQTSSIKVQPVEPQTICSTSKQLPTPSYSSHIAPPPQPAYITPVTNALSPQIALPLSPPQSTSTPLTTPEGSLLDKTPKPALPPKPAIKPPPRLTQASTSTSVSSTADGEGTSPPPLPLSDPPEDNGAAATKPHRPHHQVPHKHKAYLPQPAPVTTNTTSGSGSSTASSSSSSSTTSGSGGTGASEMIIKARPLTIKKQPLAEQPKLRNVNSYAKMNGLVNHSGGGGSNRRIDIMPPPPSNFVYPPPTAEVNGTTTSTNQADSSPLTTGTVDSNKPEHSPTEAVADKQDTKSVDEADRSSTDGSDISRDQMKDEKPVVDGVVRRCKKGNLKQTGKSNLSRRVSFDPLALLLDASLEGELELVRRTAEQVSNPSQANDEGITALHNAICAGHLDIVRFLVQFGCDVNAQDSDGWTPLHCAASCNNLAMVRFLVEHGACIFATTLSDHETAAEKCEEDEEGFDGCSEYLYSVQEKLGILSNGEVYAVFDYTAQQPDELSFKAGQQLTVLRKGDENEREWWWSRLDDKEGYVPRNLLGLYPRVTRNED